MSSFLCCHFPIPHSGIGIRPCSQTLESEDLSVRCHIWRCRRSQGRSLECCKFKCKQDVFGFKPRSKMADCLELLVYLLEFTCIGVTLLSHKCSCSMKKLIKLTDLLITRLIVVVVVLPQDFNFLGTQILSCGMDHSLKVWDVDVPVLHQVIRDSHKYQRSSK